MKRLLAVAVATLAAACAAPTPPATPPAAWPEPPVIAAEGYVDAVAGAETPLAPAELRAFLARNPLITYMEPVGSVAPPVESVDLQGTWPQPGAVRRLKQADGHYLVERVLENTPETFRYQAWGFTGPAARGVSYILAEQRFTANASGGTTFAWTYRIMPRSGLTAIFVRRLRDREVQPFIQGATARMAQAAQAYAETRAEAVAAAAP